MTITIGLWVIPLIICIGCITRALTLKTQGEYDFGTGLVGLAYTIAGIFVWFLYFTILYFLR